MDCNYESHTINTENIVDILQELIDCYKVCTKPDHPVMQEIGMWRKKFAEKEGMDYMNTACFLAIPSERLLKNDYRKHYGLDTQISETTT